MSKSIASLARGFTLVELVMVIILIAVVSMLGIGLFANRSAFSPLLATQQLSSATLLAQQAALAGNPSKSVVIRQLSDELQFDAGGETFTLAREGSSLSYRLSGGAFSAIPATGLTVSFDGTGRVAAPVPRQDIDFRVTGSSQFDLCLSSLGAVYQGACQ
ncbi:prepilin-type N-terminal cleavage/methylation domain-containing protein [Marinobacter pelagius]|uniref:prepilin-type N-terminal cleavage/methylation domain-containing protein n=1 Tax=Marinobacter sp. C7 TaxID=2951363 RepID=UPI001EEF818B|nr:prepilin-type N-terminal cleavage/methylation domain-containing protein [Marinobacter sp. C7]MCG7201390.1 prepilin-type N-terminal cleavage/methylation domain-containing protein [Marinobacter sp. C7]